MNSQSRPEREGIGAITFQTRLTTLLRTVDELPTLPKIALELQRALQDTRMGAAEIALLIEEDVSLTANVLKIVNSAHFGTPGACTSVRAAVARLGFREIQRLATSLLVIRAFAGMGEHLDHQKFWRHSLFVAFSARSLAERTIKNTHVLPDQAYLAGLLHDTGKLILDQFFEGDYQQVLNYKNANDCSDVDAELHVLGMDHGEVGALLLELWRIDDEIVEAVRGHHLIDRCNSRYRAIAELVSLGDSLAHALDEERTVDGIAGSASFEISDDDVRGAVAGVQQEAKRSLVLLSL